MNIQVIPVHTKAQFGDFLDLPELIYDGDPHFIAPPRRVIRSVLGPKNPAYRGDNLRLFVAYKKGKPAGRAAAFFYEGNDVGGIGFFECINDPHLASLLLSESEAFLKKAGCTSVQAPVNFGERDQFWGLLIESGTEAAFGENYNPSYYQQLFENKDYSCSFTQFTWKFGPNTLREDLIARQADLLRSRGFSWRHYEGQRKKVHLQEFLHVYNLAWKDFAHFKPLDGPGLERSMKMLRPVWNDKLLWFTYSESGEPIALYLSLIDINPFLKGLKGRLHLINRIRVWLRMLFRRERRIRSLVFGVVPAYQNQGVAAGMIREMARLQSAKGWKQIELAWTGDFNPRMTVFLEKIGAQRHKTHITLAKNL